MSFYGIESNTSMAYRQMNHSVESSAFMAHWILAAGALFCELGRGSTLIATHTGVLMENALSHAATLTSLERMVDFDRGYLFQPFP
jgi:hypothetical protein